MTVKTTPPSTDGTLKRKGVFEQFAKLTSGHVLWCAAAAGSGKTTAAASFVLEEPRPFLWLSLDEADGDPATLFRYLAKGAAALHASPPELPRFTPGRSSDLRAFARRFFRALYPTATEDWWLVLDNYHFLPPGTPVHQILRIAMEELPAGGRVLVTSRQEPPADYAALRLAERVQILPAEVLLLSPAEAVALARMRHPELSESAALEAHRIAQGWIAGVVLTLRHLAHGGSPRSASAPDSHQLLFDYFFSEVWRETSVADREFLVRMAELPLLSRPAVRDLGGRPDGVEVLEALVQRHQFAARTGNDEPCYELHALFRGFLRAQAGSNSEERQDFLLRAADWYGKHGLEDHAADLLARARHWEGLYGLILRQAPALVAQARSRTLLGWIERLPAPLQEAPWSLYWRGTARLFEDPPQALDLFAQAADGFRTSAETDGEALAVAGAMDAILYGLVGAPALDPWLTRLEELLAQDPAWRSPEAGTRVLSTFFRSLMMRRPQHPHIRAHATELLQRVEQVTDPELRLLARLDVAFHHMFVGELDSAFVLLEKVDQEIRAGRAPPMSLVTFHRARAWYALLTQDQPLGRRAVEEGLAAGQEHGVPIWHAQLHSTGLALGLCAQDAAEVREHLEALEALPDPARKVNLAYNHCTFAWLALEQQRPDQAARHVAIARKGVNEHGLPFLEALGELAEAQVLAAHGELNQAGAAVGRASSIAESMDSDILRFSCDMRRAAIAEQHDGDPLPWLRQALALGHRRGFAFYYWWRRDEVALLFARALKAGIEPGYVSRLVWTHDLPAPVDIPTDTPWPWRVEVLALGPFEVHIEGQPLRFSGKVQRRPLELLMALVARGGHQVPESVLADDLWPDAEGDQAHRSFVTTLQRLRNLLGSRDLLILSGGRLSLDSRRVRVDLWELEVAVEEMKRCVVSGDLAAGEDWLERLLVIYRGPLLVDEPEATWAVEPRLRARTQFQAAVADLGMTLLKQGAAERAARCFRRALDVEPSAEVLCQGAIAACRIQGDEASVRTLQEGCPRRAASTSNASGGQREEMPGQLPDDACCDPS